MSTVIHLEHAPLHATRLPSGGLVLTADTADGRVRFVAEPVSSTAVDDALEELADCLAEARGGAAWPYGPLTLPMPCLRSQQRDGGLLLSVRTGRGWAPLTCCPLTGDDLTELLDGLQAFLAAVRALVDEERRADEDAYQRDREQWVPDIFRDRAATRDAGAVPW